MKGQNSKSHHSLYEKGGEELKRKRFDKPEPKLEEVSVQDESSEPNDDQLADLLKANPYLKPLAQQIKQKRKSLLFTKNKPTDNKVHD